MIDPALRSMLPPGVAVVAGPVAGFTGPLYPQEQAAVARAVPRRVADFTAGRIAARRALAHLGVTAGALERGPGGAPLWPPGTTGSISHGGGMVAAAAAPQDIAAALGVDIEPLSDRADALSDAIAAPEEAARARAFPHGLLRLFSAKEAAFKALYPRAATLFGFDAVAVTLADTGFALRVTRDIGRVPADTSLSGGQAVAAGFIVSAVLVAPEMWQQ